MLTMYLDDSDADTGAVLTIAGYAAESEDWARFEVEAEGICQTFGVDVIHCTELEKGKGCFKGWSTIKKTDFILALREAMIGKIKFGISRSVPKSYFKRRKAQLSVNAEMGAYGFGFATVIDSLCFAEELGLSARVKAEGVAYKVESGHKNNPELAMYVLSLIENGNVNGATTIEFVEKRSCRAIQISDLYAFYSRRNANKFHKSAGKMSYLPDLIGLHIHPLIPHYNYLIEEPYVSGTSMVTGEKIIYPPGPIVRS